MRNNHIYTPLALVCLAAAFLVACSNDEDVAQEEKLAPLTPMGFGGIIPHEGAETRASFQVGGKTFLPYVELYPQSLNLEYTTIGAFMAQDAGAGAKDTYTSISGYFRYKGNNENKWETTVGVKPENYFIYGYMPSNASGNVSITKRPASATWADGCVMNFRNLDAVTPADVCVVVGVLKAPGGFDKENPWGIDDNTNVVPQLKQGQYAYTGTEVDNYVYLLLDHLYTNVNLELAVEDRYSQLRTIVLKHIQMKAKSIRNKIDVEVTLGKSNTNPIERIKFPDDFTSSDNIDAQIFPRTETEGILVSSDVNHPTSIPGYFAPGMTTQAFDFEFTYDVYDKAHPGDPTNYPYGGNLVRKDCKAVNKWSLAGQEVLAGKSFKVTATIKPTYLYQLSEPDLDNPTIELNSVPN